MNQNISLTIDFVKKTLEGAEAGHDWFHTERVWRLARLIAKTENCNQKIVEISALLHDIATQNFITEMKPWHLRFQRNSLMK